MTEAFKCWAKWFKLKGAVVPDDVMNHIARLTQIPKQQCACINRQLHLEQGTKKGSDDDTSDELEVMVGGLSTRCSCTYAILDGSEHANRAVRGIRCPHLQCGSLGMMMQSFVSITF